MDLLEHTDISENVRNATRVVDFKICSVEQRFMRDTTVKGQFLHTFCHWRAENDLLRKGVYVPNLAVKYFWNYDIYNKCSIFFKYSCLEKEEKLIWKLIK